MLILPAFSVVPARFIPSIPLDGFSKHSLQKSPFSGRCSGTYTRDQPHLSVHPRSARPLTSLRAGPGPDVEYSKVFDPRFNIAEAAVFVAIMASTLFVRYRLLPITLSLSPRMVATLATFVSMLLPFRLLPPDLDLAPSSQMMPTALGPEDAHPRGQKNTPSPKWQMPCNRYLKPRTGPVPAKRQPCQ